MSFKNKLKEAYSQKVTAPKGYKELQGNTEIKKTHHTLFKTKQIQQQVLKKQLQMY